MKINNVTEEALFRRIQRCFDSDEEKIRKARIARNPKQTGTYYIEDCATGKTVVHYIDIEDLGREIGVLKEDEQLA